MLCWSRAVLITCCVGHVRSLHCLDDDPDLVSEAAHYDVHSGADLPADLGGQWSLKVQCRLEFGEGFGLCDTYPSDQCQTLWCSHASRPHLCRTKRGPPAPGTPCGPDMECRDWRCVYVGGEAAVDGQWSGWSAWEACSADCGVGITTRTRHCSDPGPAYGGKECEGEAESWDTCVSEECVSYHDWREAHCAVWNDMNIRPGHHDWLPYPAERESDVCKQTCISRQTGEVVTIEVEVSDGTPCDYDRPSNICVLGTCLTVGCDGVQNSTKDYDSCGVCGGDNSQCKNVTGVFQRSPAAEEEYESVVFLPKGARNIDIVKKGRTKHVIGMSVYIDIVKKGRTKHVIALQQAAQGRYVVNGAGRKEPARQLIVAGARVEYTTTPGQQTFTSRGPLHADLNVMLFPNGDLGRASVTYAYTVHKDDVSVERRRYQWRFKEWSDCSVTCGQGVTSIIYTCYDKDSGRQVPEDGCQYLDPPRNDTALCSRTPCSQQRYIWAMTNDWSACSAGGCGEEGEQRQGYECQVYFLNNGSYLPADIDLCDPHTAPRYTRHCTAPPCPTWTVGNWSQCSVTCGQGRQSRRVYCGDPDTDADDVLCTDAPPALSRPCTHAPCPGSVNDEDCADKYPFCALVRGLHIKCRSSRFLLICCRSCWRHDSSARAAMSLV
ncbi:hypothetical protein ACOMHN_064481 [Nucella lapillus]